MGRSSVPGGAGASTRRRPGAGFAARVDPAFPEQRLAVEYDGAWHGQPGQLSRDRRRLDRLTTAGRRVLSVTAADLHDPVGLLARIVAARGP
ncbi:MAG TPA: hypothetical protein VJ352_03720 [Geodermatophilus sp.]|nr:hypothetical protein [Geodermatophilus sp.]